MIAVGLGYMNWVMEAVLSCFLWLLVNLDNALRIRIESVGLMDASWKFAPDV